MISIVYRRSDGEACCSTADELNPASLLRLVYEVQNISRIVIDGVDPSSLLIPKLFSRAALREDQDVSALACTSSASYPYRQETHFKMGCPKYIKINSWTWDDYKEAFEKNISGLATKYRDLIAMESAYYYAGGSMRLMLGDIDKVVALIDGALSQVVNYRLLMRGLQGEASEVVVNSVMQLIDLQPYPLSAYVIKKLSRVVDDAYFAEAEVAWANNPVVLSAAYDSTASEDATVSDHPAMRKTHQ